jgi:tellurite methyltransferase
MEFIAQLKDTDIYLLDQILKERVAPGSKILDAGCGGGRNLPYFLGADCEVFAVDTKPGALERARQRAKESGRPHDDEHFRLQAIESLDFEDSSFDLVICNAVLHFAEDQSAFEAMLAQLYRVTKPGGLCFCRLASDIGIENLVLPVLGARSKRTKLLPDGTQRFLVDMTYLLSLGQKHGLELADPIKTVNVQNERCMTNWVWRK